MTLFTQTPNPLTPSILSQEEQQAVWFLGALVRLRVKGDHTHGNLSVLEHLGERGYSSPLHSHATDEETFLVLDGELRVEVDGHQHAAGPGSIAVLPRALPHSFVVTSPTARFLTLHTPAGFEGLILEAGSPADASGHPPLGELPPDPAELARMAAHYGIEILGPPPAP
ncbi:cupin domain-containing protein [Streptacidiphilus sp. PAMC 29251]